MSNWKYISLVVFGFIALILLASKMFYPPGNAMSAEEILQYGSEIKLKGLARMLKKYSDIHNGESVNNISDLLSVDDALTEDMFRCTDVKLGRILNNTKEDREKVDGFAQYVVPERNNFEILVCEKPGLWNDRSVAVCYSDLKVKRYSLAEFEDLKLMLK